MATLPISRQNWKRQARQALLTNLPQSQLQAAKTPGAPDPNQARLAFVGIGQPLGGDDAAGLAVAEQLAGKIHNEQVWVGQAGPVPENCSGPLRRFRPDLVILIDAAQMDAPPGAIRWLELDEIGGMSASTHSLPLSVLAKYLAAELGCRVALLGIQPAQNEFGAPLSPEVKRAVMRLVMGVAELLKV